MLTVQPILAELLELQAAQRFYNYFYVFFKSINSQLLLLIYISCVIFVFYDWLAGVSGADGCFDPKALCSTETTNQTAGQK